MAEAKAVIMTEEVLTEEDRRAGYILVELGPKLIGLHGDPERCGIFHEADYRHPNNNEALVVAGCVVKVYPTAGVRLAEAKGALAQTTKPATPIVNVADQVSGQIANPNADAIATLQAQVRDMQRQLDEANARAEAATKSETTDAPATDDTAPVATATEKKAAK